MKMKSILANSFVLLCSLSMTQLSLAQVVEEKLSWSDSEASQKSSQASGLRQQKKAENEKKWNECTNLAKSNQEKYSLVKAWVLLSWLRCSRELSSEKKNPDALIASLKVLDQQPLMMQVGPWKNALMSEVIKSRMTVLDLASKSKTDEAWKQFEKLIEQKDKLEKVQKSHIYFVAGEMLQAKTQLKAAQTFYEQSLSEQDSKIAREKLTSLLFALNEKPIEAKAKLESTSEVEGSYEERFRSLLKSNDLMSLLEDCLSYLREYPGGKRSKWAQEKAIEIYMSFAESRDEKMIPLKEKALISLEKADSGRLTEWSRQLHRRADFAGALRLSERALETLGTTPMGSTLFFIAGRSAQMTGQYAKARKHFETYIQQFSGGEDLIEVHFRLGLIHLRMGQASSAVAAFEKLLQIKNGEKYELNARYWLARSLQATNNVRALGVADEIISRYPMSYYGLRLQMERTNGILEWPAAPKFAQEPKGSVYLSKTHKKALDRAQMLSEADWVPEALQEINEIPMPSNPQAKALMARKLSRIQAFPSVIKLVNEAMDLQPEYRALNVVQLSFPQVYKEAITEQATRHKLNPYLVRSLIRQESAFAPKAVSTSNAYGLMQLIGPTAQEVMTELGLRGLTIPEDVFLPDNNIQMGTYYIAKMIRQFGGNVPLGLAAYNAGPHRMQAFSEARKEVSEQIAKYSSDPWDEMWFDELPWYETSFYVKAILRNAILYQLIDKAEHKDPDQRRVQFGPVLWTNLVLKP